MQKLTDNQATEKWLQQLKYSSSEYYISTLGLHSFAVLIRLLKAKFHYAILLANQLGGSLVG